MSSSGKVENYLTILITNADMTFIFIKQYCPDKKLYGFPDYDQGSPLSDEDLAKQPHVVATCFPNNCVPAEIAPYQKQIGTC